MRILCSRTEFLKNKFIQDLENAEEEHTGENEIPLSSHFLQIKGVLEAKDITASSTPTICLKNCLYNAISALEECAVLSEKREPRKKKDKDGPMHGYTLAEHWLIFKTRRRLIQIKRKLISTADSVNPGVTDMASSSSSTSLPVLPLPLVPRPHPDNFTRSDFPGLYDQVKMIADRLGSIKEGFQEIGIVGIGGSGKTTLARLFYTRSNHIYFRDYRIWICLFPKLSGDIEFKKMIKDMLKQCEEEGAEAAAMADDEEELLENLGNVLKGKKYLIVLDGIWDINIDWYFKLKEKLKSLGGDGDGHVVITSRLPYKARMMVGAYNLYHMQPLSSTSIEEIWSLKYPELSFLLAAYKSKLNDEVMEHWDGLPLAMYALAAVIDGQILGPRGLRNYLFKWKFFIALINSDDDAALGKELLRSCETLSSVKDQVIDASKVPFRDILNKVSELLKSLNARSMSMIVIWSGDAMANQLMQVIMQVVKNLKLSSKPPILLLPLGSKANISFSLGWENQAPGKLPKHMFQLFEDIFTKPGKDIDSWGVAMKMKSIPEGFKSPSAFSLESDPEAKFQSMEGDKEFHVTFWNYFIIGLDVDESLQKRDNCCGGCCFKHWLLRSIVLRICVKTKDQHGEWKEYQVNRLPKFALLSR